MTAKVLHQIQLAGPWEIVPLDFDWEADAATPARENGRIPRRVKLPLAWGAIFGDRLGKARFSRHFHTPTNLGDETVWIIVEDVRLPGRVCLNGTLLGHLEGAPEHRVEFEVTRLLTTRNLLSFDLTAEREGPARRDDDAPCGLWKPVVLQIRSGRS